LLVLQAFVALEGEQVLALAQSADLAFLHHGRRRR
jgi:hypothetical protein